MSTVIIEGKEYEVDKAVLEYICTLEVRVGIARIEIKQYRDMLENRKVSDAKRDGTKH